MLQCLGETENQPTRELSSTIPYQIQRIAESVRYSEVLRYNLSLGLRDVDPTIPRPIKAANVSKNIGVSERSFGDVTTSLAGNVENARRGDVPNEESELYWETVPRKNII